MQQVPYSRTALLLFASMPAFSSSDKKEAFLIASISYSNVKFGA